MGSRAVSGPEWLPDQVFHHSHDAVAIGMKAGCAHLGRFAGCLCVRARVELSVAPDSLMRAGLEQSERLTSWGQNFLLHAENEAWSQLQELCEERVQV